MVHQQSTTLTVLTTEQGAEEEAAGKSTAPVIFIYFLCQSAIERRHEGRMRSWVAKTWIVFLPEVIVPTGINVSFSLRAK